MFTMRRRLLNPSLGSGENESSLQKMAVENLRRVLLLQICIVVISGRWKKSAYAYKASFLTHLRA